MGEHRRQPSERAVETWLRRSLAARYAPVLDEPLPGELVRLAAEIADPPRNGG